MLMENTLLTTCLCCFKRSARHQIASVGLAFKAHQVSWIRHLCKNLSLSLILTNVLSVWKKTIHMIHEMKFNVTAASNRNGSHNLETHLSIAMAGALLNGLSRPYVLDIFLVMQQAAPHSPSLEVPVDALLNGPLIRPLISSL